MDILPLTFAPTVYYFGMLHLNILLNKVEINHF
jgi:hypothetical protein